MPEEVKTLIDDKKEDGKSKHSTSSLRRKTPSIRKAVLAKITLLDDSILDLYVDRKSSCQYLLDRICETLNILEKDYFGLSYDSKRCSRMWIDPDKRIAKYMKNDPWKLYFRIKFYPPDPATLQEDITRYQLCLQVRSDLISGKLPASFISYSLLGSYMVQSELGNYDETEMGSDYLNEFKFAPEDTLAIKIKIKELHKTHMGQNPAEAELNYLENAKKLPLYGVDSHSAKDSMDVDININVCSSGILIYKEELRINRFAWPKILKIGFKRSKFYIKVRPGEYEQYERTVCFKLANRHDAKKLWKVCVEQHTFFRAMTPVPIVKHTVLPRFGSRFRYSGRTLYECKLNTIDREEPRFQRSLSGSLRKINDKYDDRTSTLSPEYIGDVVKPKRPARKNNKNKSEDQVKEINDKSKNTITMEIIEEKENS